jgi:hypothetical protein
MALFAKAIYKGGMYALTLRPKFSLLSNPLSPPIQESHFLGIASLLKYPDTVIFEARHIPGPFPHLRAGILQPFRGMVKSGTEAFSQLVMNIENIERFVLLFFEP